MENKIKALVGKHEVEASLEDLCYLRYLIREVTHFKKEERKFKDRSLDIHVVDCTAPMDLAYGIDSNIFQYSNRAFVSRELHSKLPKERLTEMGPEYPLLLADAYPNDRGLTARTVESVRKKGYSNIWMLIANASLEGVLYAKALFKLEDEDYVTQEPYVRALFPGPCMISPNGPIINGIGMNAELSPAIIYRRKIKTTLPHKSQ